MTSLPFWQQESLQAPSVCPAIRAPTDSKVPRGTSPWANAPTMGRYCPRPPSLAIACLSLCHIQSSFISKWCSGLVRNAWKSVFMRINDQTFLIFPLLQAKCRCYSERLSSRVSLNRAFLNSPRFFGIKPLCCLCPTKVTNVVPRAAP